VPDFLPAANNVTSKPVNFVMNKITSRDNPKLKHAKKVRDGKAADQIFIEGLRLAEEAIRSRVRISDVLLSSNFIKSARSAGLFDSFLKQGISVNEVDNKIFQPFADTKNSQGIILICERPDTSFSAFSGRFQQGVLQLTVFLSEINNPSNLGAIFRTAEAAGVSGIIVSKNSTSVYSPKALRASMGASLRMNVWENAEFNEAIDWSRANGLITTAADINAPKAYTDIDWRIPRLLIMGSEAHGLNAQEILMIEEQIRIPMENDVESLNLAVSCGIMLYEAKRQWAAEYRSGILSN
jgi:TrmH family RNA methyltransferase